MAKSANPIDQHRRAERKKELNKNKKARISARDAKVAATRSLEDIQNEIRQLERRNKKSVLGNEDGDDDGGIRGGGGLDSMQIKKLERLRKELKIVKAESARRAEAAEQQRIAAEKAQLASMKTVEGIKAVNESKYSTVERYASVYYDPIMNPYGVPPPGQPRLYFGVNSVTTMDLNQAVVPEKYRDKVLEKEGGGGGSGINSQRKWRWDDGPLNNGQNGDVHAGVAITVNGQAMQQQPQQQQQFAPPPPPPPPPPPFNAFPPPPPPPNAFLHPPHPTQFPPPPPPPSNASVNSQQNSSTSPPPPPPPPVPPPPPQPKTKSIPSLPKPSASVIRASRKTKSKLLADIWASAEEMDYDTSLQSSADYTTTNEEPKEPYLPKWQRDKIMKKKNKNDMDDVNDPCCPSADGYSEYRNREQIERQALESRNHHYRMKDSLNVEEQSTKTITWYYADNSTGAIQGPFTGLQMHGWKNAGFFPETTPVRRGEDGEFVAMGSVDFMAVPNLSVKDDETDGLDNDDNVSQDVQNDALAASNEEEEQEGEHNNPELEISQHADDENETEANLCVPPPEDDEEGPEVDLCVPPPSDDEDDGQEVDVCLPPPSDDEGDYAEVDACLPPPLDDEDDQAEETGETIPSYPAPEEDNGADVPYPVDDAVSYPVDDAVPYPVDDAVPYPVDVDYPVDVAYPVDDAYTYPDTDGAYEGDGIAAVAPYPGADDILAPDAPDNNGPPVAQAKKKFDGDKVVVGFVPSTVKRKGAKIKKSDGQ